MTGRASINLHNWLRHALINQLQTLVLLLLMGGYLALLGWFFWGTDGAVWMVLAGVLLALLPPSASPRLIMRLHRGRLLAPHEAPELYQMLTELARRADLPALPALYYLPTPGVNAFAVGGRGESALAVTDGLLSTLERRELVGVLAHEVSHIRNNDLQIMGLADMASRLTGLLSAAGLLLLLINLPLVLLSQLQINWLAVLFLLLAPQLSILVQLALCRVREYDADLGAACLTGDPEGLARALVKLERQQRPWWRRLLVPGKRSPGPSMLRTHPPTPERVRRLRELKQSFPAKRLERPVGPGPALGSGNGCWQRRPARWHLNSW